MKALTKTTIEKVLLEDAHQQLEYIPRLERHAQLLRSIAALANASGGRIVVGFDPQQRKVLGCRNVDTDVLVRAVQTLNPVPMVQCYLLPCQEQELLVLDVEKNPDPVYTPDGSLFVRVDAQIQSMGAQEAPAQERPSPQRWVLPVAGLLVVWMVVVQALAVFCLETGTAIVFGVVSALMTIVFLSVLNWHSERSQAEHRELRLEKLRRITRTQDGALWAEESSLDVRQWLQTNLETLEEAYTWSEAQTRQTFWLGACVAALGILCMAVPTVLSVVGTLSVEMAMYSTIGGVVLECLAAVALVVYRQGLKQMSQYHTALQERQRFLSRLSLLEQFHSPESKDEALKLLLSQVQEPAEAEA